MICVYLSYLIFVLWCIIKKGLGNYMEEIKDLAMRAEEAAGNWRDFGSFAWHGEPDEGADNYTHICIGTRDSNLMEESNRDAIQKRLSKYTKEDDGFGNCAVDFTQHNCWAHGYRDMIEMTVYMVVDGVQTEEVTPWFKEMCKIEDELSEYAVLDDDDYSQRQAEATYEYVQDEGWKFVKDGEDRNGDWVGNVIEWLHENEPREMECRDDYATPSEDSICRALDDLGLSVEDEEDEDK